MYVDGFTYTEWVDPLFSVTLKDLPTDRENVIIPPKIIYEGTTYDVVRLRFVSPRHTYDNYYTAIKSISIPASLSDISLTGTYHRYNGGKDESGFLGEWLPNLEQIIVDADNANYASYTGCLYTKDMETLLFNPSKNKTVLIPPSVKTIGDNAFYHSIVNDISLPISLENIGERAFFGSAITSIQIPMNVTTLQDETFAFSDIQSVSLPEGLIAIGNESFQFCKLQDLVLPNTIESIGERAFSINSLTKLVLPPSLKSIGEAAFEGNPIAEVYCSWDKPIGPRVLFDDEVYQNATLYVPIGKKDIYKSCTPWRNFWNIEEWDAAGVENVIVDNSPKEIISVYNINGQSCTLENPGILFIRYSDGTTEKIINK